MKSLKPILTLLLITFLLSEMGYGQQNFTAKNSHHASSNSDKTNFTVKPFTPSFVQNKGQFDQYDVNNKKPDFISPSYGSQMGNTIVLFNRNSIQFVENISKKKEEENDGKESPEHEFETYRQTLTFVNSNPNAEFNFGGIEQQYFNYPDPAIKNGTITANGCKIIGIKNIYAGIDVTYSFKDEGGIEYSFIVHAGADASVIKMQWSGVDDIAIDKSGNLQMNSENGIYTDNAPVTYYADDESPIVASGFILNDNTVTFSLSDYDHSKTLVIDPWVHDPAFTSHNSGYDIQHDPSGNIYVYGGATPYQLQKFTSLGNPIWTYSTGAAGYYGDFTIDAAGNAYCIYGPWGDQCLKINPAGGMVWSVGITNGGVEIYRIFPNPVNGQLTVIGMQLNPSQTPLILSVDPSTGLHSPYSFHPTCSHGETRCMSVDANGDSFSLVFSTGAIVDSTNLLWKNDATNTTTGSVPDGYLLGESQSSNTDSYYSGFNGTAVSSCSVYTYDGMTVKKWDKTTLALQGSVAITGGIAYVTGGLCTDSCGNVYVGGPDSIIEFDNNLVHLGAVHTTGQVYDVNNGNVPGEILACGQAFFGSYSFPVCTNSSSSISENVNIVSCDTPFVLHPTATGNSYLWSTGATTYSISVITQGTYWVHVIGATVCSQVVTIADTFNITFASPPIVNLGPDHSVCGNGPDTLHAGNPGDTYIWNTGATTQNISINTTNTYYVTVNNGGCSTVDSVTVTFVAAPTVNLGPDTTICSIDSITLNAGNTGFNFLWNTGATTQTITVNTAGNYFVYVSQSVCHGADTIHIFLVNPPVVSIGPDSTICSNQSVTLNAGNTGSSFTWSTGATTQSITANTTGIYWVHVSNSACSANDSATIIVIQMPIVDLGPDHTICVGDSINLNAGNPGYYFHWSTGETTQFISVNTAGNYWVIVNLDLCAARDTIHITTINPPHVNLGNDTIVCSPNPVTLNAGNSGSNFVWSTGDQTQTITINSPGVYTVLVNNQSCVRIDTIIVSVVTPPVLSTQFFADTTKGCNPLTINITNQSSGGITYLWNFGDHQTSTQQNPSHTYTDSGLFTISLIIVNDTSTVCGRYTDSAVYTEYIAVADPVHVIGSFSGSPIHGCTPLIVDLVNTSTNGTNYIWEFGNSMSISDTAHHLQTFYVNAGTYTITLIASSPNSRCYNPPDTMSIQVTADSCNLYVPNVFSPNGDGKNEYFHLAAEGYPNYHLIIFNRWGQKIFESLDKNNLWNGKIDNTGGDAPDGTYYYIFTAIDPNEKPYTNHGFLTLIR